VEESVEPSDAEQRGLIERARGGDEAAFGVLVRSNYEPVFRLVFSIVRNEHDARDVCQEVWIAAWRAIAEFRGDAKLTTWLHPIAVRRSIDFLRGRKRWIARFLPFLSEDGMEPPGAATTPDPRESFEATERSQRFERAIAALPAKHRAVLVLREVEGLSYEEIAKTMKLRPGTVMSRLHNARRMLARKIGDAK
jgi:RNA polymerase sigma-70 factor (ECF subfamily)